VIWSIAGKERCTTVKLSTAIAKKWGVIPMTKSRALRALEVADLVKVKRYTRQSPDVTLIASPSREQKYFHHNVSEDWLLRAGNLSSTALHVGCVIWAQVRKVGRSTVAFSYALTKVWGVSHMTTYRALQTLEEAGLIRTKHFANQSPSVTLLVD